MAILDTEINKGIEAEKYAYDLSKDRLLEQYCFLNPFILNTDNKEICDLLIIANNTAIIISVKNYEFSGNYERFNKQVFEKSKRQLLGAKRKLLLNNLCTIIDKNKKQQDIDFTKLKKIILLTLNYGHSLDYYNLIEKENATIIHNLDKDSFETVLFELDSVPEMVEYFEKKENLFSKFSSINIFGEEKDLLAWFVTNKREFPIEWTKNNVDDLVLEIDGRWEFYDTHKQTILKRDANKVSYFVDELVKNEIGKLSGGEIIVDYLMGLNRVQRRMFSLTFFDQYEKYKNKTANFLSRRHCFKTFHDAGCLMLYYVSSLPENELDDFLRITAEIYLYKTINHHQKIIFIGTTKDFSQFKFGFIERTIPYSQQEINYYEDIIKKFGWFTSQTYSNINVKEYPDKKDN